MAVSDPYPGIPVDGGQGDAIPILAKFNALFQGVQNFDGSQIAAGSVVEAALANSIDPRLRGLETIANFVYSGCLWSIVSGFQGTMTGGTIYVNGYRQIVTGVGSETFNASNDTYVDIDYLGNIYYLPVSNGGTSPGLTANALRVAKIVTSGSAITSIVQSGVDGNNVLIYNQNPPRLSLVNSVQSYTNAGAAGGTFYYLNLGGIKLLWGSSASVISGTSPTAVRITFPVGFFTTIQSTILTSGVVATTAEQYISIAGINAAFIDLYPIANTGATTTIQALVIGT